MTVWNMAAFRHRQTPREHKMHGPVGPKALLREPDGHNWCDAIREVGDSPDYPSRVNLGRSCRGCGYHVCSCPNTGSLFGINATPSMFPGWKDDAIARALGRYSKP